MFNELVVMITQTNQRIDSVTSTLDSFDTIMKDISKSSKSTGSDPVVQKKIADVESSIASLSQSFKVLTDEIRNIKARLDQEKTTLETSIYSRLEKLMMDKMFVTVTPPSENS